MITQDTLRGLLELAIAAARSASELILSGFRSPSLAVDRKSDGSPVTKFDRESELAIRAYLERHQPNPWPVLGEEFGGGESSAGYRWVLDPIDGTLPFSRGLPTFGTLLAFEDVAAKRSLLGVIHLPAMNETYSGARGLGAWCGTRRLAVAGERALRDCLISAPAAHQLVLAGLGENQRQLVSAAPHLRCFADCWAHAMVASGAIDALAEFSLARWDIAASEVIIEEAGGRALIRDSREVPGKYDIILGSPRAASDVASLLSF